MARVTHQPTVRTRPAAALRISTLIAAVVVALAPQAASAPTEKRGLIARSSGHGSELVKTIPIKQNPAPSRTVVMSIGPDRLPKLREGMTVQASGEVQLSLSCLRSTQRCIGSPYNYNPELGAQIFLAASRGAIGGPRAIPLSPRVNHFCTQYEPDRNHHCPQVIDGNEVKVPHRSDLPCPPEACFINLVVDVSHANANEDDLLIVGIDTENGEIHQGRGRLDAILRYPGTEVKVRRSQTDDRMVGEIPMTVGGNSARTIVYSLPLGGVREGDVIAARSLLVSDIAHLDYNAFVGNQIVIAESPTATQPGLIARRSITAKAEVSPMNGFNCTQAPTDYATPCKSPKIGVVRVDRAPVDEDGDPIRLYVNLLSRAFPKRVGPMPSDEARVVDSGYLRLQVLREIPR